MHDITERFLLHTLMDNLPDGIYFKDTASRFVCINRALAQACGLDDPALAVGKTDFDFFPEAQARSAYEDEQEIIRTGQPIIGKEERAFKCGRPVEWVSTTKMPLRDREGVIIGTFGVSRHITELKHAEEELRRTTALLQGFVDETQDAVYVKDREGRHLMFNAAASRMVGKPIGEVLGQDDSAIFDPDSAREVMAHDRQVMENGVSSTKEHELSTGGVTRTYLSSKAPYRDSRGNVIGLIGLCHDITDLKRAEEALRESERRFRTFVDHAADAFFLTDEQGRILDVNRRACESLGYTRDELIGMTAFDFVDLEPTVVEDRIRQFLAGESVAFESRHRRKDGTVFPVETRGKSFQEGGRQFMVVLARDVRDRKRDEEAIRLSEQRYRSLIEASAAIVWTLPASGVADKSEQPSWSAFTGQTSAQIVGWGWLDCVHPEDRDYTYRIWTAAVAAGTLYQIEYRVRRRDGAYRNMLTRGVPILAGDGSIREWFGTCIDITDLKQLEEELLTAKMKAEAANRAKDDFLANVSHEIRTPMNAIICMTELVLDTPLDEDQRQGLKTVKSAADSLLGIINDLLDFSKIEAGKLELVPADFSLRGAVGDTLRALAVRAHKKGLELVYHVQPDVPDALMGDAGRLRQVLLNLVGNAVKFTDEGEVVVEIQRDGHQQPPDEWDVGLRFTVRDTGIGIPPDQQERIFRAFEQEDTSTTRKYGGTGLGLTIAARLVALMSGQVSVDSTPGRGSTFAFTARFGRQPHPPEPVPASPPVSLHDLPVLVVDDNVTNRHILAEWLRGWQMNPTAVGDGMAAMDALWHRAANGRPYALVLLDARMPDADGLTVAARIREKTEFATTRIILLTSGERPGDPARVRDLRIDAKLLKPVQQDELLETIYRVMSRSPGNALPFAWPTHREQAGTAPVPATLPLNILVAEDNELSAQVLEQSLVRQGHRVRLASNGREVLALAEQGFFDLLLLDVHMPELDGFEVVRAVREQELTEGGHLPIIALTARTRKEDRERCLAAGMDDFQTKPIRPAELLAAIDRVLRTHSSPPSRRLDLLDASVLLAACGGDPSLLRKMCQTLTARVPEHLAALREALHDRDAPRLREAAHKCCGMLSEFSAAAGDLAGSLEELAAGTQLEKATPILEQIETIAQELVKQVDGITVEALRRLAEGLGS